MRQHRDALKARLAAGGGLSLDELEYHVRMLILTGRFAGTNGIPETMLMPFLPERFLMAPSPFRTIAELSSSLPWLLRVHQSMQWVSQMPNGLMTVQRLICPAASDTGGLAAPDGVLAIDWRQIEEVLQRQEVPVAMQGQPIPGDPRFPRNSITKPGDPMMVPPGTAAPPPGTVPSGAVPSPPQPLPAAAATAEPSPPQPPTSEPLAPAVAAAAD